MHRPLIIASTLIVTGGLAAWMISRTRDRSAAVDADPTLLSPVPDAVSEQRIRELAPQVAKKARQLVHLVKRELGIDLRVTDGYRTYMEQADLYAQGREESSWWDLTNIFGLGSEDKPQIVTNAKPGESYHNYRAAFDVVPMVAGKPDYNTPHWEAIGEIGKSIGLKWGGDFTSIDDEPHFHYAGGMTITDLQAWQSSNPNAAYPPSLAGHLFI